MCTYVFCEYLFRTDGWSKLNNRRTFAFCHFLRKSRKTRSQLLLSSWSYTWFNSLSFSFKHSFKTYPVSTLNKFYNDPFECSSPFHCFLNFQISVCKYGNVEINRMPGWNENERLFWSTSKQGSSNLIHLREIGDKKVGLVDLLVLNGDGKLQKQIYKCIKSHLLSGLIWWPL